MIKRKKRSVTTRNVGYRDGSQREVTRMPKFVDAAQATNARTLFPRFDWLGLLKLSGRTDEMLRFPTLLYRLSDNALVEASEDTGRSRLIVGGSWNRFLHLPLHKERCAIFEDNAFPYDYPFRFLEVRNACLLWPSINLDAYTWLDKPWIVFLRKPNIGFCVKLEFRTRCIELTETTAPRDHVLEEPEEYETKEPHFSVIKKPAAAAAQTAL